MDCRTEIQNAKWIIAKGETGSPVIEKRFVCSDPTHCRIAVTSLGYFILYVNGRRVGEEYFVPANSLFHERDHGRMTFPVFDRFTYRCYYTVYDLSSYVREGENLLEIALGSGMYRQTVRLPEGHMSFGEDLGARFALEMGEEILLSDGSERFRNSELVYDQLYRGEIYDARIKEYFYRPVSVIDLPDTLLTESDTVPDRIVRRITPKLYGAYRCRKIYDAGENISGFATVRVYAPRGYEVRVRFSEEVDGRKMDYSTCGRVEQLQEDVYISDGTETLWEPRFVWHGFRYVEISGDAEVESIAVVHSDLKRTATFTSSSEELNWLFESYLRAQLNNMHGGVPSDCPHRERLGYTGDGQLCAPSAMTMLDTKDFYRKWMRDVFDSQDPDTGHVNYTAPFAGGGGGPGGWGGAAVYVPYYYWKFFGDDAPLREYYGRMRAWISYMESHSEGDLVVRGEKDGWCLGDWCTLEKTVIPEPFVNTCVLIETLGYMEKIALRLGKEDELPAFQALRERAKAAVMRTYYDPESGSFAGGVQGADALALASGLGDERTFSRLVTTFGEQGFMGTGILATPALCDLLFERGEEDLAFALLTSHQLGSFGYMMDHGATTLWEEWDGVYSHDHPMFGACAHHLISSILGITQTEASVGFETLLIAPKIPAGLEFAKGSVIFSKGKVAVSWRREEKGVRFEIELPDTFGCDFVWNGQTKPLTAGKNIFTI